MKDADRRRFGQEMAKTAAVLRAELSDPLLEGFWEAFEGADIEAFSKACRRAREELDFMPSIHELRRLMPALRGPSPEALATDAYLKQLTASPWPKDAERLRLRLPPPQPKAETEMQRAIRERMLAMSPEEKPC